MKSQILIIFVIFLISDIKCDTEINPNVVGGVDTSILDHPYMAGVHINFQGRGFIPFCGAGIINRRSVLTAAHCMISDFGVQASARDTRISVGSSYRNATGGTFYNVFRIIRHPQYTMNNETLRNDVAIIRLTLPLIFTRTIQPIALGRFRVDAGDMAMVVGWGFIDNNGRVATRMQRLLMRAMTNFRCRLIHGREIANALVHSEVVCLSAENWQGICGGDSGSPLELHGHIVGIASWTLTPCGTGPSVYVRVSEHFNWINANV